LLNKVEKLDLNIRSLRRDELEKAWQLQEQGFPYLDVVSKEDYLRWRSRPGFDLDQIIIAEVDGSIVGKIEVYPWFGLSTARRGFVDGFIVSSAYRGKGIGTHLLIEAEKRASKKGIKQLELGAETFAEAAIYLYEKLGYKKLHKVFFLKASTERLQISRLPNDVNVRQADPSRDAQKMFRIKSAVWWGQYPTQKLLKADIEGNPERFLVLECGGEVQAYMKYDLREAVRIFSWGISSENTVQPVLLLRILLSKASAKAMNLKTTYIEVDEGEERLLGALRSLGFEVYETEIHMRKRLQRTSE